MCETFEEFAKKKNKTETEKILTQALIILAIEYDHLTLDEIFDVLRERSNGNFVSIKGE